MTTFSSFSESQAENRRRVVKMALLYTPITAVSLTLVGLALFKIANGDSGFFVMFFVFGMLALLTGFQTVGYLKDLNAAPIEYEGELIRKWHKGNLFIFFMPSFYLAIDSRVQKGRIRRVEEHGCYVVMANGGEGYLPRKEMDIEPNAPVSQAVGTGSDVQYKVLGIDKRGGYRLSQRRVEEGEFITKLFSVTKEEYALLLEHDLVRVACYPHSNTVECVYRYDDIEKKFIPALDGVDT